MFYFPKIKYETSWGVVFNPCLQESVRPCTPRGRDCYANPDKSGGICKHVDCEGLYADVDFENLTNSENIKDKLIFESLVQVYNGYKESYVKNLLLEDRQGKDESVPVCTGYFKVCSVPRDYHPLQVVQIYFSTATYDKIVNDVSVSLGDQISAIGGTMGLFAGFSILSAVEILYFILKFLSSLISRTRFNNV